MGSIFKSVQCRSEFKLHLWFTEDISFFKPDAKPEHILFIQDQSAVLYCSFLALPCYTSLSTFTAVLCQIRPLTFLIPVFSTC